MATNFFFNQSKLKPKQANWSPSPLRILPKLDLLSDSSRLSPASSSLEPHSTNWEWYRTQLPQFSRKQLREPRCTHASSPGYHTLTPSQLLFVNRSPTETSWRLFSGCGPAREHGRAVRWGTRMLLQTCSLQALRGFQHCQHSSDFHL